MIPRGCIEGEEQDEEEELSISYVFVLLLRPPISSSSFILAALHYSTRMITQVMI